MSSCLDLYKNLLQQRWNLFSSACKLCLQSQWTELCEEMAAGAPTLLLTPKLLQESRAHPYNPDAQNGTSLNYRRQTNASVQINSLPFLDLLSVLLLLQEIVMQRLH